MRKLLWCAPIAGAAAMTTVMLTQTEAVTAPGDGKSEIKQAQMLPVSRVILFNSGVAHFARSGEIEGDARIDLTFPEDDINDLIKSMVLEDFSEQGKVSAVTYDSHDPIDRTLRSFAIDLNNNPSFAQILTQARGEKIEVTLQQNATGQPGTLTGSVIGIEKQKIPSKEGPMEVEVLNMWCQEGVRSVKLSDLQRLRFLNPIIENEMRRALETLALSHDSQKKAVSVNFTGEGKRKVRVSYVIEAPIWKTSYRLVLDKNDKPFLQGWAVVENPTDEDWNGVGMALVSGRPISFKMDLYNPLYVKRPTVEPELFASLRPPTYGGAMANSSRNMPQATAGLGGTGFEPDGSTLEAPEKREKSAAEARDGFMLKPKQQSAQNREYARQLGAELNQRMDAGKNVASVATASQLGDYFQYTIDIPVYLGRQKSALLPIVNREIEGKRVSIYNANVQSKHPLLGLKFKNTSTMNLAQGPITVFEGSTYAGDTRILDLQKNEERLVSYAVDLGTEVSMKPGKNSSRITKVRANKGVVYTETILREERVYDVINRSDKDRVLLIEHPNRKGEGFTFVGDNKPAEEAADVYRFETSVTAGKNLSYVVTEERPIQAEYRLTNSPNDQINWLISLNEASPALKAKLKDALSIKAKWDLTRRDMSNVERRIQTISKDQDRLRQNLREMPRESDAYKTYLKKFDEQEKEMTTLHDRLKNLQTQEEADRAAYENFLNNLSVE